MLLGHGSGAALNAAQRLSSAGAEGRRSLPEDVRSIDWLGSMRTDVPENTRDLRGSGRNEPSLGQLSDNAKPECEQLAEFRAALVASSGMDQHEP